MSSPTSIKVGVRVRPLSPNELRDGCLACVTFPGNDEIIIGKTKQFGFDYVFSDNSSQQEIYDSSVKGIINNLFVGYNVTVLAYGQTGSGKTYTMDTNCSSPCINENTGIIPRAIFDIYKELDGMRESSEISVKVSFIEVYNEEILDLLSPHKEIRTIREENNDIKIPGLIEECASTMEDVFRCLIKGSSNRVVGSTAMNETSSRSHAIFTMYFNIISLVAGEGPRTSKLQLVDLAGSERAGKTQATGDRFKEGVNINKGLLCLSQVISALVERERNKEKNKHVPYRQSKLTRILQDSLGGNTKTLMLACVGPADSNFEETSTTLNYAARARMIQNKPVVNKATSSQDEINQLRAQVSALKAQLSNGGTGGGFVPTGPAPSLQLTNVNYGLNARVSVLERQKLEMIEAYDEEMTRRDDIMKKVWDKMIREGSERDEIFEEFDRFIQELPIKDEQDEMMETEEEKRTENVDDNESTCKRTDYLKSLKEELKTKEKRLENTEEDLKILLHYEERNRELEHRIKELEEEKVRKSQNNRSEEVEVQLKEVRRQLAELQNLKREKDRKTDEVNQLRQKINELKNNIVKVTKDLRKEKDQFRKMAADKDKECKILVMRDRKLQCQIEKQADKYAKETAVWKRKLETSTANEKRLKELIENKKNFSVNRFISRDNVNKNINSQVKLWIRQSLDQAAEQCETKQRVVKLIEKRRVLTERLTVLDEMADGDERAQTEAEIRSLNECLSLQQANLADGSHHDAVAANWNQLRNINECRVAIKFTFGQLVEERVRNVMNDLEIQEMRTQSTILAEVNAALNTELEQSRSMCKSQTERAMRKARYSTSINFQGSSPPNSTNASMEPANKRKKVSSSVVDSDAHSVLSEASSNSRRSMRISQSCKCKNGCKASRCGCLRAEMGCSKRCGCRGDCSQQQLLQIEEMEESDKENQEVPAISDDSQTIVNEDIDKTILNATFTNLPEEDADADGDGGGETRAKKTNFFPSLSNSRRNVV